MASSCKVTNTATRSIFKIFYMLEMKHFKPIRLEELPVFAVCLQCCPMTNHDGLDERTAMKIIQGLCFEENSNSEEKTSLSYEE